MPSFFRGLLTERQHRTSSRKILDAVNDKKDGKSAEDCVHDSLQIGLDLALASAFAILTSSTNGLQQHTHLKNKSNKEVLDETLPYLCGILGSLVLMTAAVVAKETLTKNINKNRDTAKHLKSRIAKMTTAELEDSLVKIADDRLNNIMMIHPHYSDAAKNLYSFIIAGIAALVTPISHSERVLLLGAAKPVANALLNFVDKHYIAPRNNMPQSLFDVDCLQNFPTGPRGALNPEREELKLLLQDQVRKNLNNTPTFLRISSDLLATMSFVGVIAADPFSPETVKNSIAQHVFNFSSALIAYKVCHAVCDRISANLLPKTVAPMTIDLEAGADDRISVTQLQNNPIGNQPDVNETMVNPRITSRQFIPNHFETRVRDENVVIEYQDSNEEESARSDSPDLYRENILKQINELPKLGDSEFWHSDCDDSEISDSKSSLSSSSLRQATGQQVTNKTNFLE